VRVFSQVIVLLPMFPVRYNKVRVADRQAEPVFSCQNELTLKGYLKERLNFSGFVVRRTPSRTDFTTLWR